MTILTSTSSAQSELSTSRQGPRLDIHFSYRPFPQSEGPDLAEIQVSVCNEHHSPIQETVLMIGDYDPNEDGLNNDSMPGRYPLHPSRSSRLNHSIHSVRLASPQLNSSHAQAEAILADAQYLIGNLAPGECAPPSSWFVSYPSSTVTQAAWPVDLWANAIDNENFQTLSVQSTVLLPDVRR